MKAASSITLYQERTENTMEINVEIKKKDGTTEKLNYPEKKKSKTSAEVKNRYNAKTYKRWNVAMKPELYDMIEAYCDREGLSRPQFLARAIEMLEQEKRP